MSYKYKAGRIWMQTKKFAEYELFLLSGMTDVTDPIGSLGPVREPSPGRRGESVVVDVVRGSPDLPSFRIETRLRNSLNFMLGLRRAVNYQCHMGACDRADNYYSSDIGLLWHTVRRGDLGVDRTAMIDGDDQPVAVAVPWYAEVGPVVHDFKAAFLSARTITETEAITDVVFLSEELFEECRSEEDPGENGYAVTQALAGSPINVANVWYTEDKCESWQNTSTQPFAGGEDISCVVALGRKNDHRIIVSRGTTDGANPAEIAYADVTAFGTTSWINVDVGSVDGQYITRMCWLDWNRLFAVTNDGYIYKSTNGGVTWSNVLSDAVNQLNDIVADRKGMVWAVGDSNTIRMSEDFGNSWSSVTGPSAWSGVNITAVDMTPDGTLFLGGSDGTAYGTYDSCTSFTAMSFQGVTATNVVRFRCYNDDLIWAIVDIASGESKVLKSTDGGATFRLWNLSLPDNDGLEAIFVVDQNIVCVAGQPHGSTAFVSRTATNLFGL